jgi:predicted N-acyltransferase
MDGGDALEISVLASLDEVSAEEWDRCADPGGAPVARPRDPFTTHRFLKALEDSCSVGRGTGWQPRHLVARLGGRVVAAMPLYAKGHSQGEYVFDHAWAHAYERAGGDYYPKLQGAVQVAAQAWVSSLHVTFCEDEEWEAGGEMGLLQRTGQQFHWVNRGYADFDAFLASLSSRKRKTMRKERAQAQENVEIRALTGEAIEPEHWEWFWRFYQDTGARKWGRPYLTRAFFDRAQETLRDDALLVLAYRAGRPVAGALNFIGRETLFGRYWGCLEHHPCLHFELCYYQAIDFAIREGLARVEAGAQGEHKLARGYLPVETRSLHWIADRGFRDAVEDYLEAERRMVREENALLAAHSPFRREDLRQEIEEHD